MDKYFLTCPRGLEEVTKKQISSYVNEPIKIDKGGVHFYGNLKDMYTINLHSRTGMRLLKNIFAFDLEKPQNLYKKIYNLDWLKSVGKLPIHHKEYNPYKEAFWKWWPDLYPKLHTFRITGGEPLLSKDTWKVFDYIKEHPNKDLILAVNTNNNAPDGLIDRMIEHINDMTPNIKYFDVYTSLENTGPHAEYSREGMDFNEFMENCYKVLDNTPDSTRLHFMTTINLTSAPSFLDYLKIIKEMRAKYQTKIHEFRVRTHFSYLRYPRTLMLSLLNKEDKERYGEEWLSFVHENKLTEKKHPSETFYLEEVDQIERLVEFMRTDKQPDVVYTDMRLYIKQLDERRGNDFCKTFPELAYLMEEDYYG